MLANKNKPPQMRSNIMQFVQHEVFPITGMGIIPLDKIVCLFDIKSLSKLTTNDTHETNKQHDMQYNKQHYNFIFTQNCLRSSGNHWPITFPFISMLLKYFSFDVKINNLIFFHENKPIISVPQTRE